MLHYLVLWARLQFKNRDGAISAGFLLTNKIFLFILPLRQDSLPVRTPPPHKL